jgi:pimeloyl-ACP methyl ester carboxylesterase
MSQSYSELPNRRVTAADGIDYVYRDAGQGEVPLVLLQHFRGNLDNWGPALIDALASGRRVTRPSLVRRLVLASAAPRGGAGMHGWAPDVIAAVGGRQLNPQGYLQVFFTPSETSRQAGVESLRRMSTQTEDRDQLSSWQTREAQYDAVCCWGLPNHSALQRLSAIEAPTFVANGASDPMILPKYSYLLTGLIPDARVKIYHDSAHGFLFQHHAEFAADVEKFLAESPIAAEPVPAPS